MQTYYNVFHRTWWHWENGVKTPGVGKRKYIQKHVTFEDARELCREWNAAHEPGPLSDKAEFEEV